MSHLPQRNQPMNLETAVRAYDVAAAPARELTLEELSTRTLDELRALYTSGGVPTSLHALDGSPRCRVLAIRATGSGRAAAFLRRVVTTSWFPWAGKRFDASDEAAGSGINRVRLMGQHQWFPFATRIEPSVLDARPCILLDYDDPRNPRFIRGIRDELREVADGLFLGPAMLQRRRGATLVLFFACDTRNAPAAI